MSNKKSKTILAFGADMKNKFLIGKGNNISFGPDIGDLSETQNFEKFKKEICLATNNIKPDLVACDLHPSYFSTRLAKLYNPKPVQHHHAHIASVIEEYGLKKPVIGVSFDGTGFGTDGNVWGGEFLLVNKKGFKRLAHLRYCRMPGGDKVVHEPWRMVLSILGNEGMPFVKSVKKKDKKIVLSMLTKNVNSPLSSSAGRLFDACAALLGLCAEAAYEAEGPIKLESMCLKSIKESYKFKITKENKKYIIDTKPIFSNMARELKSGRDKRIIATKFHNSMARIVVEVVRQLSKELKIKDIALSGGVFQNKFLTENIIRTLKTLKFNIFINDKVPVNDLNIALGQYHVLSHSGKN